MKNKKEGFTLIELLAVIVILAIIALIATPIVLNLIEKARKGAAQDSAYGVRKAAQLYYQTSLIDSPSGLTDNIVFNCNGTSCTDGTNNLEIDGTIPKSGYIVIKQNGSIKYSGIVINDFTCDIKEDGATCVRGTIYQEAILNGADPVLNSELIPVIIQNDGIVTKADTSEKWYSYENKEWANAVILKENGIVEKDGTIKEESIREYYVWIPRYRYKLWNVNSNNTDNVEKPIEIEFGINLETTGVNNGDWYEHPAFTNFDTNGIWVGKYEVSYDEETYTDSTKFLISSPNYSKAIESKNIIVKPNVRSLTNKNVSSLYTLIKGTHENLNSHMMTNMEWGATAYLTYSKYGRCDDSSCTEVTINNVNTGYLGLSSVFTGQWQYGPTITGCAGDSVSASVVSNSSSCVNNYNTSKGYLASTTGNITGIYDMSGGSWEYVMGVLSDANGNLYSGRHSNYNSGFKGIYGCLTCDNVTSGLTENTTGLDFPSSKYYDRYVKEDAIGTDIWYDYTAGKLGDATKEIANTKANSSSGDRSLWFSDYANFVSPTDPFVLRGGSCGIGTGAGVLAFYRGAGGAHSGSSARSVLAY